MILKKSLFLEVQYLFPMPVKITLTEFRTLPRQEQFDVLFTIGDYLESHREFEIDTILYAVDLFFVEVYYDPILNEIINIKAFVSGKNLDKYSQNISHIF